MSEINLRHGIFLPPFHPNEEDPTQCLERDLELMTWLDRLGFHEAWIGEHHSAGFEIISSPEIFIAVAAERTKHIRFGTHCSISFLHIKLALQSERDYLETTYLYEYYGFG